MTPLGLQGARHAGSADWRGKGATGDSGGSGDNGGAGVDGGGSRRAAPDGGCDRSFLNVNSAEVPVFLRVPVDDSENTDVEVPRVSEGVGSNVLGDPDEWAAVGGGIETNSLRRELFKDVDGGE